LQRVVTGVALATLLVASVFVLPTPAFVAGLTIIAGIALYELLALIAPNAPRMLRLGSLGGLGLTVVGLLALEAPSLPVAVPRILVDDLLLFVLLALPLVLALSSRAEIAQRARIATKVGFAWIYLGLAVVSCAQLHLLDPRLIVVLLAVVGLGDTAAFYVGSHFGKHKLAPTVSPNKSWEGAAASLGAAVAVGWFASWWLEVALLPCLLVCAVASVFGQLGDLLESMLKRAVAVKDSGSLLPGHGGVLDRADAVILAAPVFRITWEWFV
jgi:phosphatidate cytidylyltransferase